MGKTEACKKVVEKIKGGKEHMGAFYSFSSFKLGPLFGGATPRSPAPSQSIGLNP